LQSLAALGQNTWSEGTAKISPGFPPICSARHPLPNRKAIPHIKLGRLLRFRESEINEWLQSNAVTPGIPSHAAAKPKGQAARVNCSSDYIDRLIEKAKKEALK